MTPEQRRAFRDQLRKEAKKWNSKGLGVYAAESAPPLPKEVKRRRNGLLPVQYGRHSFNLMELNDTLFWDFGPTVSQGAPGLRRSLRSRAFSPGEFVDRILALPLEANMVSSFLRDLDTTWNPSHGLKIWKAGHLKPILPAEVEKTGKLLLIVHGTFSNADAILTPLKDGGFLKRAVNHYQQILAFDHPSVSVSPVLNAIDLARQLEGTAAEIHVIAHSRGGLVSRWWLEALDRGKGARKAVLVGSPLNGTSLATPRSIRSLMSWMSNLSRVIGEVSGAGGSMIPFLTVIAGLARIAATVTNLASKVPAVDAAIAMVPGLAAMSRENFELARLNVQMKALPAYFAVTSDFQPPAVGWEFWKAFQGASIRAVNALVDPLFDQANDLVVDTGSMDHLWTGGLIKDKFDFGGTNSLVYHTNYFEQQPMLDWMATKLGIP